MIIGLTGSLGAGKGTIIEYLKSQGFEYFTLSDELRKEAVKRNIPLTRSNLQDLGNEFREREGPAALAKRALANMQPAKGYIVDGVRNPGEIKELKSKNNFFLVSIDAPAQLRFQRMLQRNQEKDPRTWEEFLQVDARDKGKGEKETGQQNAACMELSDFQIYNDGDIGAMHEEIQKTLGQIQDIIHQKALH
ncbi:AAA family ATPase [Nanoarchaeota archaeon]